MSGYKKQIFVIGKYWLDFIQTKSELALKTIDLSKKVKIEICAGSIQSALAAEKAELTGSNFVPR
ncbi:MAG: hypothetical protein K0B15_01185 [Lentimicrobium sp.]|nr:hypothetical protein [Lentimicrobium sp.]